VAELNATPYMALVGEVFSPVGEFFEVLEGKTLIQ
jgi:hypothetical protein